MAERLGINLGSLIEVAHRIGKLCQGAIEELSEQYRRAEVRHADETSWQTDGHNGYAWLFATEDLSIYLFRPTRSAAVAKEILGNKPLGGVLVVDRYNAYNRAPCQLQYCYAHLMREVEDLAKEFAAEAEVERFCSSLIPLLAQAMHLRTQAISDRQYYKQARQVKAQIEGWSMRPRVIWEFVGFRTSSGKKPPASTTGWRIGECLLRTIGLRENGVRRSLRGR